TAVVSGSVRSTSTTWRAEGVAALVASDTPPSYRGWIVPRGRDARPSRDASSSTSRACPGARGRQEHPALCIKLVTWDDGVCVHETNAARAAGEAAEPSATGSVAPGPLRAPLWIATAAVALAGLAAEVGEYRFAAPEPLVELFSLSYEANVPTWYATVLLFACSALLATIARAESITHRTSWSALAAIFAYMSLDEAIQIHEHLAWLVPPLGGVLHFG